MNTTHLAHAIDLAEARMGPRADDETVDEYLAKIGALADYYEATYPCRPATGPGYREGDHEWPANYKALLGMERQFRTAALALGDC